MRADPNRRKLYQASNSVAEGIARINLMSCSVHQGQIQDALFESKKPIFGPAHLTKFPSQNLVL